jgi:hypothetical protein
MVFGVEQEREDRLLKESLGEEMYMANKFKSAHDFRSVLTKVIEDERVILSLEKMDSLNFKESFKNLFIIGSYKHL